jgi:sporulation protein YlmC with PRC-barrel domain
MKAVDRRGRRVGTVEEVHLDASGRVVESATIRCPGGGLTVAPLRGAAIVGAELELGVHTADLQVRM